MSVCPSVAIGWTALVHWLDCTFSCCWWSWFTGCFVNYILLAGYLKCLGVFYVELLHRFEAQATEAALIFSVRAGVVSVSSKSATFLIYIYIYYPDRF